jgi:HemK-like putative methylase
MRFFSNQQVNIRFLDLISRYESNLHQAKREFSWMLQEIDSKGLKGQRKEEKLLNWIESRTKGKPLAYCLGWVPFIDLKIFCRQPVLIPRWETEEWTINLIQKYKDDNIPKPAKILDLCSGSGCISIALAKAFPQSIVDGIDISPAAIRLARYNQRSIGNLPNLKFHHLDLFSRDSMREFQTYSLIVSNPPYISKAEYLQLDRSVAEFEDPRALLAADNGLEFYQHITSMKHLFAPNSLLVYEIGDTQGVDVKNIILKEGFTCPGIIKDGAGTDRVVIGYRT